MKDWYLMSVKEVSQALRVQPEKGLTLSQVDKSRETHGWNIIPKSNQRPLFLVFFDRFKDSLVIMLTIGAVASIIFGRYGDAVIIGIAILLDATLSFVQVVRTEKTIEKLREQIQPSANVVREGKTKVIPATELVVGDVVEFGAGEKLPADGRIIETQGLAVNESSLTGESDDNDKSAKKMMKRTAVSNRHNMVYMGTVVTSGRGKAIVTAIGVKSEIGKIAQMLRVSKSPASPLNKQLQKTGKHIGIVIVLAIVVLSLGGLWSGMSLMETTVTAITLIVSAIPEDLTMILTIALTIGVARILKYKGVVKELSAGETLGSATVICTDKTGTLTYGKMKAAYIETLRAGRVSSDDKIHSSWQKLSLTSLALANDAHRINGESVYEYIGSPTEGAALELAERNGFIQKDLRKGWVQRDAISFSRQWMYRASLNNHPTQSTRFLFVNGAPEVLLTKSSQTISDDGGFIEISSSERHELQQWITGLASEGNRILGIAIKRNINETEVDHSAIDGLIFMGVLVIKDPVREDVRSVITSTERAGIQVKLVTGDHVETAKSIAREVGILASEDNVLTDDDMQKLTDAELDELIERTTIFARIAPLDKQRIVKSLQRQGHIVAMTGDGVNDAVALKGADIGVAMGSGKDIAREAADLILLDDNFKIIVQAIKEGRVLRDNLKKVMGFLLATNAAEVAIFFVSLLAGLPLPLLPAQILWINLVTDGTSDIALALEPQERNVMKRKPDNPKAHLLGKAMGYHIGVSGLIITAATMGLYMFIFNTGSGDLVYARTMSFTFLSMVSLLSVWSFRSLNDSILKRGFWGNKWVPVSLGASAALQLLAVYVPQLQVFFDTMALSVRDWALIIIIAFITVAIVDVRKSLFQTISRRWPNMFGLT